MTPGAAFLGLEFAGCGMSRIKRIREQGPWYSRKCAQKVSFATLPRQLLLAIREYQGSDTRYPASWHDAGGGWPPAECQEINVPFKVMPWAGW